MRKLFVLFAFYFHLLNYNLTFCQQITDCEIVFSNILFVKSQDAIQISQDTLIFVTNRNMVYNNFTNMYISDTIWSGADSSYYRDYCYYKWTFNSKERGASIERQLTIKGNLKNLIQKYYDIKFQYLDIMGINCFVIRYNDELYIYRLVKYEDFNYGDKVFNYVKIGKVKIEDF